MVNVIKLITLSGLNAVGMMEKRLDDQFYRTDFWLSVGWPFTTSNKKWMKDSDKNILMTKINTHSFSFTTHTNTHTNIQTLSLSPSRTHIHTQASEQFTNKETGRGASEMRPLMLVLLLFLMLKRVENAGNDRGCFVRVCVVERERVCVCCCCWERGRECASVCVYSFDDQSILSFGAPTKKKNLSHCEFKNCFSLFFLE